MAEDYLTSSLRTATVPSVSVRRAMSSPRYVAMLKDRVLYSPNFEPEAVNSSVLTTGPLTLTAQPVMLMSALCPPVSTPSMAEGVGLLSSVKSIQVHEASRCASGIMLYVTSLPPVRLSCSITLARMSCPTGALSKPSDFQGMAASTM